MGGKEKIETARAAGASPDGTRFAIPEGVEAGKRRDLGGAALSSLTAGEARPALGLFALPSDDYTPLCVGIAYRVAK